MRRVALVAQLLLCAAIATGLQGHDADLQFRAAPADEAIAVANERQLRAALTGSGLSWRGQRAIQLTADMQISAPLLIGSPVRLEGACSDESGTSRRCILRGDTTRPLPLLHVNGPGSLVEIANLELSGGVGEGSLAGGVTASNHSGVTLIGVRLSGNTAASGGAARADSHASLTLVGCEVDGNAAQQSGGGIFVHSARLHLDRTSVVRNVAVEGGGVAAGGGSRVTASRPRFEGNRLSGDRSGPSAGADLALLDGDRSAAYADPLPEVGELSVHGGELRLLSLLSAADGAAADPSQLHRLWEEEAEPQQAQQRLALQRGNSGDGLPKQPTPQQAEEHSQRDQLSEGQRVVLDWMEAVHRRNAAGGSGGEAARGHGRREGGRGSRKLKQAYTVGVTTEQELAAAIQNKERFIRLDAHIGLTGAFKSEQSVLPPIRASITITGNCPDGIYSNMCLLDAKALGRIISVDNSGFLPSFFVKFENVRFTNGAAQGLGGAFSNQGRIQAEFDNCQFVTNSALSGAGAVNLQDGAIGLFNKVTFQQNSAQFGAGGAVYLTSNAGFTEVAFQSNSAPSGGAVGVGQSSTGIYFNGCSFNGNQADVFGNDLYMESWVATPAFFNPFPTSAEVYPATVVAPYSQFVSWPAYPLYTSPPPSPPAPPRPPPPSPPSPPDPGSWVYTEEQLWQALAAGNNTVTLGAHIQMTPGGRWWQGPPPTIVFGLTVNSQCAGFGSKCIVDLNGAPNPLFLIQQGAIFYASNVRVINGATMANGAAVQVSGFVRTVTFDSCDFMGNMALDGGAVNVLGSSNVVFRNCAFGVNWADNSGGAVKTVGANVTFDKCTFYQNRAGTGGAIGMGPNSNIVLLTSNFSDNLASKSSSNEGRWGDDIFIAAPAGSTIALNQLPPESVAAIYPRRSNTLQYTTPPPMPAPPPLLAPPFKRPPFPAPLPQPPFRVRRPPPSPPSPPPLPPPAPPSPPIDRYLKSTPFMWGPIVLGGSLLVALAFFALLLCCHRRLMPKLDKPGELEQRLRGDYHPSDSEEEEMSVVDPTQSEIEVTLEGYYGTARFRRKPRDDSRTEGQGGGPGTSQAPTYMM